jgi:catechol 2,3-dioxygenase-like lactoylglutathione lyase family enzyme
MAAFESIAPILPVRDLDAALDRYRRLGFAVRAYPGPQRYGFADRDAVSLHLAESPGHDPATTSSMVYLYVDDADAVHAEWSGQSPAGHLVPPEDKPWRVREFSYVDPDGTLHRVGALLD